MWDLERFGLTPSKVWARLANRQEPRIFVTSIPKAGTHLVERALCLHPRLYRKLLPKITEENLQQYGGLERILAGLRPGQILLTHLPHRPEYERILKSLRVPGIFVIRDPRDIVVSDTFFILRWPGHPVHQEFRNQPNLEKRLELAIRGIPHRGYPSLEDKLRGFSGWLRSGIQVIRFEDLVGRQGGGNDSLQEKTFMQLFDSLGLPLSPSLLRRVKEGLFYRKSPTFRRGRIGQWREYFTPRIEQLFWESVGPWMKVYGYAQNEGHDGS